MGVAPEPLGDSSRVARGVASVPSRVRLRDLIFVNRMFFRVGRGIPFARNSFRANLTGACALDFGSFADPSPVGPVAELLGPMWAKERKIFATCIS